MTEIKSQPSGFHQITEMLAIKEMPWVVRAYFFIFLMLVAVLFGALFFGSGILGSSGANLANVTAQIAEKVLGLFELVIGAVLGSLSMAAERTFRIKTDDGASEDQPEAK